MANKKYSYVELDNYFKKISLVFLFKLSLILFHLLLHDVIKIGEI